MTFYWYDLETFGQNPAVDRIAQFAGVRTNERFEPLEEPQVFYCRIPEDYLPDPRACMITGITPQETIEKGELEYQFIQKIRSQFMRPGTCVVGFNSIRFDDEFIRNCLYRNFYDPYEREWSNGNSRWDILDLLRAAHDLRPQGIEWISNEEGKPVFRLEELTKANGIEHLHAHDALSDVFATISMAKLVAEKQPKLFNFALRLRNKNTVKELFGNIAHHNMLVHTSGMFTREEGCSTVVAPLGVHPVNGNCILSFDLRFNPEEIVNLSVDELRNRIFTPTIEAEHPRIPIKGIHINKSPFVAPLATLDAERATALAIDLENCQKNREILLKEPLLVQKLIMVFKDTPQKEHKDPDLQIYSGGFFRDSDRDKFSIIHGTSPEELPQLNLPFDDSRIPEMLWRFIGRNFSIVLKGEELKRWKGFCASRILFPPGEGGTDLSTYKKILESLKEQKDLEIRKRMIVKQLYEYLDLLEKTVLSYEG